MLHTFASKVCSNTCAVTLQYGDVEIYTPSSMCISRWVIYSTPSYTCGSKINI